MKYFTIGSDSDYTTLATFFNGELANLLAETDPNNLPYVGLLKAETHTCADINISTTTATHYFVLRPLNKKWQGAEDSTDCATIQLQSTGTQRIPYYTIIENCIFTLSTSSSNASRTILASTGSTIKNCLFNSIVFNNTASTKGFDLIIGTWTTIPNRFYNCVWNNVSIINDSGTDPAEKNRIIFSGNKYHCIIQNLTFTGAPQRNIVLNDVTFNSLIENITEGGGATHDVVLGAGHTTEYNGFTNDNFDSESPSATNIIEFEFKDIDYFISDTYLPKNDNPSNIRGGDPQIPLSTINGVEYWPYLWWNMGLLYFRDILLLTQNNKYLIFRTK